MHLISQSLSRLKRSLYPGARPSWAARLFNRFDATLGALGLAPNYMVALEVIGRKSGKVFSLPVAITIVNGERYLVSMLGHDVQWVHNVRAAQGSAVLVSGGREAVRLVDVPVSQCAPILKAYVQRAPGARAHIPVNRNAPVSEFEKIAADFPVFHILSRQP